MNTETRAAIYVRSAADPDGHQAQLQLEALRAFAHRLGYAIADDHVYIEAPASGLRHGPVLRRLEVDARAYQFDALLVTDLARLGRRPATVAAFVAALRDAEVRIITP